MCAAYMSNNRGNMGYLQYVLLHTKQVATLGMLGLSLYNLKHDSNRDI